MSFKGNLKVGLNPIKVSDYHPEGRDVKYWSLSTVLGTHVTAWIVCQGNLLKQVVLAALLTYCPLHHICVSTSALPPSRDIVSHLSLSRPSPSFLATSGPPTPNVHNKLQPILFFSVSSTLVAVISSKLQSSFLAGVLQHSLDLFCIPSLWLWRGEAVRLCLPPVLAHGWTHSSHFFSNESLWCIPACFYGFS